jgi:hypothetical protein
MPTVSLAAEIGALCLKSENQNLMWSTTMLRFVRVANSFVLPYIGDTHTSLSIGEIKFKVQIP